LQQRRQHGHDVVHHGLAHAALLRPLFFARDRTQNRMPLLLIAR
jgi:hypothetical protein